MRLAIDYHLVDRNKNSGMGVYLIETVRRLRVLNGSGNTFVFRKKITNSGNILSKIIGIIDEQNWIQFTLRKEFLNKKIDLIFFPNPPVTLFTQIPIVLNIPDLSFLYDDKMKLIIKIYLYLAYFFSAHKAKYITTFSLSSKKDISRFLFVSKNKIGVNPLGVRTTIKKVYADKKSPEILKKFKIDKKYILAVPGTFIPRKNMEDLLKAYSLLGPEVINNVKLVMVGNNKDSYFVSFYEKVKKSGLENNVVFTGYVTDGELKVLYSNSLMFVFPSLYEGFGLPPLEAMSCGVPVVVYNRSSLPEVVGNAALIVDNYVDLSGAVKDLFSDKSLRNQLIEKGYKRLSEYSWSNSTKNLFNILTNQPLKQ